MTALCEVLFLAAVLCNLSGITSGSSWAAESKDHTVLYGDDQMSIL